MSYEVAIWEGPAPLSNTHAASEWERLTSQRQQASPSVAIASFVDALLEVHPDLDRPGGADSPWSDGPLLAHADGPFVRFGLKPELVDDAIELVERVAAEKGLVAYDPQLSQLLPSALEAARRAEFELPSVEELPLHLAAVIGEAVRASRPMVGVLEHRGSGFYVQWSTTGTSLVAEVDRGQAASSEAEVESAMRDQMLSLGFVEADPNWRLEWADGPAGVDQAGQILGHVLSSVRKLPVGAAMALQTFPV